MPANSFKPDPKDPEKLTRTVDVATSPRAWRPSRWPISPRVARSPSESFKRPFNWPLRTRFSAAKYSLRKSNCWSTVPVIPLHKFPRRPATSSGGPDFQI
jgi:hypothetical protein